MHEISELPCVWSECTGAVPTAATAAVGLLLPTGRVLCPVHGEPFRSRWSDGYPAFVAAGLESLKLCSLWQNSIDGDGASIEAALDTRPICCVIADQDPGLLQAAYSAAATSVPGLWGVGRCTVCSVICEGCSPAVQLAGDGDGLPAGAWVCLRCVSECVVGE